MAEPTQPRFRKYTGLVILASVSPVLMVFYFLGKWDLGMTVAVVLGMMIFAVKIRWDLRKHVWFWAVVVMLLMIHIPLLPLVRWPRGWTPGIVIMPFGLVDLGIMLGVIRLAERLMSKPSPGENV